jgi:signal transduction histidine kinase
LAALAIETGRMQGHRDSNVVDTTTRKIREGLVKLSEDVHSLSYRLHPSIVDDLGLVEALKAECDQYSRLESIEVDVTIEDNIVRPSSQIALCFFRVAQEALQNISRHARAKRVEVSLQRFDGGLQICICDDGIGFDPNTRRERASLGLTSMQQRVYHLGGELGIDSSPGDGTVVWAWVPGEEERHDSPARAVG